MLLVYKGDSVGPWLIKQAKAAGVFAVNVFPDCSPHAYGSKLRDAIGEYDLVISTKSFHPEAWRRIYGYSNACVFVPHGYDPSVHYWPYPSNRHDFDIVLAANWRPEYHALMHSFATRVCGLPLQVAIAGSGWHLHQMEFPRGWRFISQVIGREYVAFLRSGRIVIAPVQQDVMIGGVRQPGDQDSTRTYEIAAAHCFMLHRRTAYVSTIFDERQEVPLWDDATELAALVRYYLPRDDERRAMAAWAHARAVPLYSASNRAVQVLDHIRTAMAARYKDSLESCRIDAT